MQELNLHQTDGDCTVLYFIANSTLIFNHIQIHAIDCIDRKMMFSHFESTFTTEICEARRGLSLATFFF